MNDSSHAPIRASGAPGLNQRLLLCLTAVSRASSCLIAVVGLAVLLGWYFDIELLRAGLPGRTPVNPATALGLLLAACALWMHHQARGVPDSASIRWLALTAASLIIALGLVTLAGYFIGHSLRVDQVLFGARLAGNRVAPNTGFALLLIGVALWLLNSPWGSRRALEQSVALFPIAVALISLLGYAYSAEGMYGLGELQRMALPTAASLLMLSVGILCARPDSGFMSVIVSDHAGGVPFRATSAAMLRASPRSGARAPPILASVDSHDPVWWCSCRNARSSTPPRTSGRPYVRCRSGGGSSRAMRRTRVAPDGPAPSLTQRGRAMHQDSAVFVGLDASKLKISVALAEDGRQGEVRFLGDIEQR